MNGVVVPAVLLALAPLVAPPPGRRLARDARRVRRLRWPGMKGIACAAVAFLLAAAMLLPTTTVLAAAAVGATVALRHRRRLRRRRGVREGGALEGALDVLVGELRVGSHPVEAFRVAADESDGAVATALRAVAARGRLGGDVTAGLRDAARSSALPAHWDRLAAGWELASQHGLAIATLMRAAQRDIAERQRYSARVSSSLAGARATAAILAALPALGVALGELIGARPLSFLLRGGGGGWVLVVGSLLTCAGMLWSDRLTDGLVS
ncbi:type II secretion system F family protein [Mycobacterium sp. Marseille-P9652]|uniref:type II secretion system F family protein n=1 Tax=Mycobacterium sp. Marseille-P9652 TaxID=2654950 RepID=UPI0012E80AAC|nr:type II secretion system F family protein [Mycobacterium sp. Marseille-P9652]